MKNYFSAADLVKRSASQIKYLRDKRLKIYTKQMESGVSFQNHVAELKEESAEEFRTTVDCGNIIIFACHDIITPTKVIEVKTIEFGAEQWYLESSVLQTAFYKSLLMMSDGKVYTPKFRIKEGYKKEVKSLNTHIDYCLQFGNTVYLVEVSNPNNIVNYFVEKAIITLQDYSVCKEYDSKHKFQHFKELKQYFKYKQL